MNNETVLKCALLAARQQEAFLGRVDLDIQDLIAELTVAEVTPAQEAHAEAIEAAPEPEAAPAAE